MRQTELTKAIHELKELKTYREQLDAEIEAIEGQIKAEMDAQGVEELKVDIFKVMWKKIVSNRFDTTAFKKAHEDIYNLFTKATETRRFQIV
jgi:predicted phage-related endonuclease